MLADYHPEEAADKWLQELKKAKTASKQNILSLDKIISINETQNIMADRNDEGKMYMRYFGEEERNKLYLN
jgi:hypothetical protein